MGAFNLWDKPCSPDHMHCREKCPLCAGSRTVVGNFVGCRKCEHKGGINLWGKSCLRKNMHWKHECAACGGRGFIRHHAPPSPAHPKPHHPVPTHHSSLVYGAKVKLQHVSSGHRLHSHPHKYPGGSKQQQVTCFGGEDDNDWWMVLGPHGDRAPRHGPVPEGTTIRLQHAATRRNLHSHEVRSHVSGQTEVSCYGDHSEGDTNDNWRVLYEGGGTLRLQHVNLGGRKGNHFLHSHAQKYPGWGFGQQEVTTYSGKDENDLWRVQASVVGEHHAGAGSSAGGSSAAGAVVAAAALAGVTGLIAGIALGGAPQPAPAAAAAVAMPTSVPVAVAVVVPPDAAAAVPVPVPQPAAPPPIGPVVGPPVGQPVYPTPMPTPAVAPAPAYPAPMRPLAAVPLAPPPPAAPAAPPGTAVAYAQVPAGVMSGQQISVTTPDGQAMVIAIPAGISAGQTFQYGYVPQLQPATTPPPMPMAVPAPAAPPVAPAVAYAQVQVPAGVMSGQQMSVTTPDGQSMVIAVPASVSAGQIVQYGYMPLSGAVPLV